MTVAENIAFGLRVRPRRERPDRARIDAIVDRLLSLIQLEGLGKRFPAQLSGGQQQRVALARALAVEPRMLLLDEPFGALDAKVRDDLRHWLRHVHDQTSVTTIFVTHDQGEAMGLADRIAVLRDGLIEQVGTPRDLEETPRSAFVFDFMGEANRLACQVQGARATFDGFAAQAVNPAAVTGETTAWFRPHETRIETDGAGLPVTILGVQVTGATARLDCRSEDGALFEAVYPRDAPQALMQAGAKAGLSPGRVFVFSPPEARVQG
jgi:sulfate transport system ATP-binding protein